MIKTIAGRGQLVERDLTGQREKIWTDFKNDSVRSPSISSDGQHVFFETEMKAWHLNRSNGELKSVQWHAQEDLPVRAVPHAQQHDIAC